MTPEQRIAQLEQQVQELMNFKRSISSTAAIPFDVEKALRDRLEQYFSYLPPSLVISLSTAPLSSITSPTGGMTVDTQARTAIDTIITRLEDLGLVSAN